MFILCKKKIGEEDAIILMESKLEITYTPYTKAYPAGFEDMQRRLPDITKIKNTINWSPAHSLDQIIDDVATERRS
jgi:UDP-glucose 4-epimerase